MLYIQVVRQKAVAQQREAELFQHIDEHNTEQLRLMKRKEVTLFNIAWPLYGGEQCQSGLNLHFQHIDTFFYTV